MITFLFACYGAGMVGSNKIDRKALVMRHNVTQTHIDKLSPLSVGNGRFCYCLLYTSPSPRDRG